MAQAVSLCIESVPAWRKTSWLTSCPFRNLILTSQAMAALKLIYTLTLALPGLAFGGSAKGDGHVGLVSGKQNPYKARPMRHIKLFTKLSSRGEAWPTQELLRDPDDPVEGSLRNSPTLERGEGVLI